MIVLEMLRQEAGSFPRALPPKEGPENAVLVAFDESNRMPFFVVMISMIIHPP